MKENIHQKTQFLSALFSVSQYQKWTGKKKIFPLYHSVSENPLPHLSELQFYRNKENFRADLDFFLDYYPSFDLKDFSKTKEGFHLTFDDGLSEFYTEVVPLLIEKKIHATVFINSDFVDNQALFYRHQTSLILNEINNSDSSLEQVSHFLNVEKNQANQTLKDLREVAQIEKLLDLLKIDIPTYLQENQPYLTTVQLKEIQKMGFTIANHSQNHSRFSGLNFEQQKQQILETQDFLKLNFGTDSSYFAFPFGDDEVSKEFFDWLYEVEKMEYSFGVSGIKNDQIKKHLHRIPMEFNEYSAEEILKFEYFYYLIKSFLGKNIRKR